MALPGIITLTTDFGTSEYVASVKGVILGINPGVKIIDLCHNIKPQNILQASYVVNSTYSYFPEGTIHMVVVDPGVGSRRKAIILKTPSSYFIGPDNGVLSHVLESYSGRTSQSLPKINERTCNRKKLPDNLEAVLITNPQYWNKSVSPVFHGRDIFAPVAAHLSLSLSLNNFGPPAKYINILNNILPWINPAGDITGKVVHVDNFGNIITNIQKKAIPRGKHVISVGNTKVYGINRFYAEKEGIMAVIGSSGNLEISVSSGNASREMGIDIGDEIQVSNA